MQRLLIVLLASAAVAPAWAQDTVPAGDTPRAVTGAPPANAAPGAPAGQTGAARSKDVPKMTREDKATLRESVRARYRAAPGSDADPPYWRMGDFPTLRSPSPASTSKNLAPRGVVPYANPPSLPRDGPQEPQR